MLVKNKLALINAQVLRHLKIVQFVCQISQCLSSMDLFVFQLSLGHQYEQFLLVIPKDEYFVMKSIMTRKITNNISILGHMTYRDIKWSSSAEQHFQYFINKLNHKSQISAT